MSSNRVNLPWWAAVGMIVVTAAVALMFAHYGIFALARPAFLSIVAIAFAIRLRWEMRGAVWFWIMILTFTALHTVLIVSVPWTKEWIPAILLTPICAADVVLMIGILKVVGRLVEKIRIAKGAPAGGAR